MKTKKNGVVYTPEHIVKLMLDKTKYFGNTILQKHIIDNSCGNGAFLKEVVKRYCFEYIQEHKNTINLKNELEYYIHGIEIDTPSFLNTINTLNNIVNEYGLDKVNWDILNTNTLTVEKYNNKMDYVIGNPPYIKIQHLDKDLIHLKRMSFTQSGAIDLFIAFYEIGINMLNSKGKLIYITPNSIFYTKNGNIFRKYIIDNKILKEIINLKHFHIFDKVTTYTAIILLDKEHLKSKVDYYELDNLNIKYIDTLNYNTFYLNKNFYFAKNQSLKKFKDIINVKEDIHIKVKHGLATLADNIFIRDKFDFTSTNIIPILKISTGKTKEIIFPYNKNNSDILDFDDLDYNTQQYFLQFKGSLIDRTLDSKKQWYGFGRSQAIKDIFVDKVAINMTIKENNIKIMRCKKGVAIYSGLYILGLNENTVKNILNTSDFLEYIKIIGKYKNGGYYSFSNKDLEKYLTYSIRQLKQGD